MHQNQGKLNKGSSSKIYGKTLACMKIFLYKHKWPFCQGDGYLWLYCCMNNLYSHINIQQRAYQSFLATSWFDLGYITAAYWVKIR